jgi:RNA polymerase sigma factor (sigma-70 family)
MIDFMREEYHLRFRRKPIYVYIDHLSEPNIPDSSSINRLDRKLKLERMYEDLQAVDERSRKMFLMRLDGLNNKQIAEKFNLRPNTVSALVSKTRSYLARHYSLSNN